MEGSTRMLSDLSTVLQLGVGNGSKRSCHCHLTSLTAFCEFVVSGITKVLSMLFLLQMFVTWKNRQGERIIVNFPWQLRGICISVMVADRQESRESGEILYVQNY